MTDSCELKTEGGEPPGGSGGVLDGERAAREAGRCLANNPCRSCDLCRHLCPELCITRDAETGHLEIDYDYCKGCGICAFICPKGAISMVRDE